MAEGVGFELTETRRPQRFSRCLSTESAGANENGTAHLTCLEGVTASRRSRIRPYATPPDGPIGGRNGGRSARSRSYRRQERAQPVGPGPIATHDLLDQSRSGTDRG